MPSLIVQVVETLKHAAIILREQLRSECISSKFEGLPEGRQATLDVAKRFEVDRRIPNVLFRRFARQFPFVDGCFDPADEHNCERGIFSGTWSWKILRRMNWFNQADRAGKSAAKLRGAHEVSLESSCDTNVSSA